MNYRWSVTCHGQNLGLYTQYGTLDILTCMVGTLKYVLFSILSSHLTDIEFSVGLKLPDIFIYLKDIF